MKWILTLAFVGFAAMVCTAQTPMMPPDCPPGMICLTRAAAEAALRAGDKVIALEAEKKATEEAIGILRKALDDMRIEYTRAAAEASTLRQNAVQDRAIIEILVKYARPKKFGLINF